MAKYYLVRHAETVANLQQRTQGFDADSELTPTGHRQVEQLCRYFQRVPLDAIYSSDSQRAMQTAQPIAQRKKLTVYPTPRLREKSYGIYDGKPIAEVRQAVLAIQQEAEMLPDEERLEKVIYQGGESDGQSARRLWEFIQEADSRRQHAAGTVLVSHGTIIRNLLILCKAATYQSAPRGFMGNGSIAVVELDDGSIDLQEVVHLSD